MTTVINVTISSDAWIKEKNNYMNIPPQFKTFFPADCFIKRGTGRMNNHLLEERGITLEYQGVGETVRCFMELRDDDQFRPSKRGAIKDFYKATKAKVGDSIAFEKVTDRVYRVVLTKPSN